MKKWMSVGILVLGFCTIHIDNSIAAEVYGAQIVDYGVYVTDDVKTEKTDYGTHAVSKVEKLIKQTDRVPAETGKTFGFRYKISGKPKGVRVELIVKVVIPQPGLTNPETGKTFHDLTLPRKRIKIGIIHHEVLIFEKEWDLVPGKWKIQLWHEGKKLTEKIFTVYKP